MRFLYVGIDPVDFSSELFRQNVVYKVGGVRQMGNQADYICRDGASIVSCVGNKKRQVGFLNEKDSVHNFCSYVLNFCIMKSPMTFSTSKADFCTLNLKSLRWP